MTTVLIVVAVWLGFNVALVVWYTVSVARRLSR